MAKALIHIPEPCEADFNAMPLCEKGSFCGSCRKHVTDLTAKNVSEVNTFVNQNPGACIRVKSRHLHTGKRLGVINRIEVFLHRMKWTALSPVLIGTLLLVSGCHHRKPVRTRTMGSPRFLKQTEAIQDTNEKS